MPLADNSYQRISMDQINISSEQSSLCNHLISNGLITEADFQKALSIRKQFQTKLGSILIRIGAISEDNLLKALSELSGFKIVTQQQIPNTPKIFSKTMEKSGIERDWWLDREILAWEASEGVIFCIARDIFDNNLLELLEKTFIDKKIQFFLVTNYNLERALEIASQNNAVASNANNPDQLREMAEEAPVIEFVNNMFSQALDQGASDVHIEPGENIFEVRFRCDGILETRFSMPMDRLPAISSRIKLISGIDISERRLPQDGRLSLRLSGVEVDIRTSSIPCVYGESIVLRLLPKEKGKFDLANIGLGVKELGLLKKWICEPHGIFLVTGPTGSGKSTTLYSALETVNDREKKIITVENPVEYHIKGINQIQTHSEIGYTFASALRSILRHDPDVIMIGEIRDTETAEIAIRASLTGHLVLSTLHTNDAVSAFTRLIDMGIDPFLVATPIRGVMAQRLVRKLCPHCSEVDQPFKDIIDLTDKILPDNLRGEKANWRRPKGCKKCHGTGFKGREGVFELVDVTPELQHLILNGGTTSKMRKLASQQNSLTMREDGLIKAWQGITSIEEVLRVTSAE